MSVRNHVLIHGEEQGSRAGRRLGFSLIELMVAIVVLGLGLVMVATVFPIAWGQARKYSEAGTMKSIVGNAEAMVELLASEGGLRPPRGSFAGDLVVTTVTDPITGVKRDEIVMLSDTRVHLLYMENLLASGERAFVPNREVPWCGDNCGPASGGPSGVRLITRPAPWQLEGLEVKKATADPFLNDGFKDPSDPTVCGDKSLGNDPDYYYCGTTFLSPQVRFEQRLHPPMRPRDNVALSGAFNGVDRQWDDALSTRRYAWAVFHRATELFELGTGSGVDLVQEATEVLEKEPCREFDMYYVMLRRPRSTLRYARQNPANAPDPQFPEDLVVPAALPASEDVVLPEPWRVQILLPPTNKLRPADDTNGLISGIPPGIPTEVEVPAGDFQAIGVPEGLITEMLVQMFPRGAWFIDEDNGNVYQVIKQRLALAKDGTIDKAILTVDREITGANGDADRNGDGGYAVDERVRTVWVFPPPVEATRAKEFQNADPVLHFPLEGTIPVFDGPPPVVAIEKRLSRTFRRGR